MKKKLHFNRETLRNLNDEARPVRDEDLKQVNGGTSIFGNCCSHNLNPQPGTINPRPTRVTGGGITDDCFTGGCGTE